jgi:crotonobetainyl-CoA:carnitine CoA-transferase CaiB-like acyl-CoA transferase
MQETLSDPQVQHLDMVKELGQLANGFPLKLLRNGVTLTETPLQLRLPPPTHGEHTTVVLKELGLEENEIARLKTDGII